MALPGAWRFHGWDLSYNISVTKHTPQERWRWVMAGIKLLRDKGIPYNPNDILLYEQLSNIYFVKIGDTTDDYNMLYKSYLAGQMHRILVHPPYSGGVKEVLDWLTPIDKAPDAESALLAEPEVAAYAAPAAPGGPGPQHGPAGRLRRLE